MIFHYAGKYYGNENILPKREHHPGAVAFQEPENTRKRSLFVNAGGVLTILLLGIPFLLLGRRYIRGNIIWMVAGCICAGLSLLPHEWLHAVCYQKEVYLYHDLAHDLMFVTGTEDMSKKRYIFMCLCPNIFLGFVPYLIFLLFPSHVGLGLFGIICTGIGFGDYLKVFHAMKQMPKNAITYQSVMHTYWYPDHSGLPQDKEC